MTGAFFHINPIGRDGLELKSAWESGAHSYLGMATVGFPNFFWIGGPQTASSLASFVQVNIYLSVFFFLFFFFPSLNQIFFFSHDPRPPK